MSPLPWKSLSLLAVTALVALGLQAGAIKIMINLAHPPEPSVATDSRTRSGKPVVSGSAMESERPQPIVPEERSAVDPASSAREPKPAAALSDPPHLADLTAKPGHHPSEPSPEARQLPAATTPTAPNPSPAVDPVPAETKPQPVPDSHAIRPPVATAPVAPTPVAEPTPMPDPPAVASELQEPAWLKARDPRHYTVQLYSGKDIGMLKEIAAAAASSEPQAYFSMNSRSGPWYSLVIGDYPDAATAQAAATRLAARSPALKPWVRRFSEIQAKTR